MINVESLKSSLEASLSISQRLKIMSETFTK